MSMFQYVLAGQNEATQQFAEMELRRFVAWARDLPRVKWDVMNEHVFGALEVVERAICACRPLSCEQYYAVCGAAAVLAYVALEADEGFHWLREFFRGVPDLFQIEWVYSRELMTVPYSRGLVAVAEVSGDGWE